MSKAWILDINIGVYKYCSLSEKFLYIGLFDPEDIPF